MKWRIGVGLMLIALLSASITVQAEVDPSQMDFNPVDEVLEESGAEEVMEEQTGSRSIGELLEDLLSGAHTADWKQWVRAFIDLLGGHVKEYVSLMIQVVALAVLSRFFSGLELNFGEGSAGSIGFLCVYGVLVMLLLQSFQLAYEETREVLGRMQTVSLYMMPAMAAVAVAGGYALSSTLQSELITGGFSLLLTVMKQIIATGILGVTIIEIVNYISPRAVLSHLTSLVRTVLEKGMKAACGLYLFLMGTCSVVAPAADKALYKASSAVLSSVPVVGSAMSGAVESVMAGSMLVKNGIVAAGCMALLCLCLVPVARLTAIWLIYRLLAAFLAPVVDERVVKLLTVLARSTAMLLGLLVGGVIIFTGAVGIFIMTTGQ